MGVRPDLKRPTPTARSSARHIRRLKAEVGSVDQKTMVTTPANKRALDAAGIEARMDAVRLKHMLGGAVTEQERMCLQIEQNGFGCGSCSNRTYAVDARATPAAPDESGSA